MHNLFQTTVKLYSKAWLRIILCLIILFTVFFIVSIKRLDPDFGWHLASGKYILAHGIPKNDIFTYTAIGFRWINHEWLGDVLVAKLYMAGNYNLLAVVFSLFWALAVLIAARRYNVFVVTLASLFLYPYVGVRAIVYSALFVAILERILESKNKKAAYYLPIVFLFWANLHGSFVIGLAILSGYYLLAKNRPALWTVILSFVATLINPYGYGVYVEVWRTISDTKLGSKVAEWQPLFYIFSTFLYLVVFWAVLVAAEGKNLFTRRFLAVWATLGMMLRANRHTVLFAIVGLRHFETSAAKLAHKLPKKLSLLRVALLSFIVGMITISAFYVLIDKILPNYNREAAYPTFAYNALKQTCRGRIFNDYNVGGYLIGEGITPVYIDGRMPSWKDESGNSYLDNYFAFFNDGASRQEQIKKYNIDCVLVSHNPKVGKGKRLVVDKDKLISTLSASGWVSIASDKNYVLLYKNN